MATQLPGVLAELELSGITGAGALSGSGCAVANADWDGAADCVGGLLPAFTASAKGRWKSPSVPA